MPLTIVDPLARGETVALYFRGAHSTPVGTTAVVGTPNTPARRRVRLHHQGTGYLIQETWSDSVTGAYVFENIAAGTYFVISFDHTGEHSGVVETDIVVPTP